MKEPQRPKQPYPRPQKSIVTHIKLLECPLGEYAVPLRDKLSGIDKLIKGKDPDTVFIHLEVSSGYYDDKNYNLVIEQITDEKNKNYANNIIAFEQAEEQYNTDMAEYHTAMALYLGKKVKNK